MAKSETQIPETLTVTCPTCHERMVARLAAEPQSVACTFCAAKVPIPSREAAQRERAARTLSAPVVEEYALAPAEAPAARPARKAKVADDRPAQAKEGPLLVSLECPTCHERVKAPVGEKWEKVACTFCGVMISVPDRATVAGWQAKKVQPRKKEEIGEYTAGPVLERAALPVGNLFDRMAEVRQEVAPPPPKWTFFSGVFTLPWHQDVFARWLLMSIGFTAMFCVGLVLLHLARQFAGFGSGIAIAFFLMPLIWISFLTLSYSAACSLCVLESTAAGLDRIEAWPEPYWKEWMAQMFYLGWIAGLPSAICYGVAVLLQAAGLHGGLSLAVFFVLYPISLMSALEANSIWVPLSRPVLGSLVRWWWCWLLFYVLSGTLVASILAFGIAALMTEQTLLLIALGPAVPAAILICARLLGRLGWRMTAKMPKRARVKQGQPREALKGK